ncbi:MAG: LysR family transcriptional regulator [Ruminococcaceae bacterium]|nr:LysR family transcriptional regulator [Oscillospiraceae bacterium]
MYDYMLDTFIAVAECGSFSKAAERLFMSPTAVMKQINSLEKHLDLKLFERRPSGIRLTSSGGIILRGAAFMIEFSERTVSEAKRAERSANIFCIGSSLLNPAKPFFELWYKLNSSFSDFKLNIVPFDDNGILSEVSSLGGKFDFLVGVCDSKTWLDRCNMLELGHYRKMIAVPREHRLAKREVIDIEDLYGETLMMVKRGDSWANDFLRSELEFHPKIKIEDTRQFYDLSVFNRCAETGNVLLTIECWRDVHPGVVTIPVNWDYTIPYGLLYSLEPSENVRRFIEAAKMLINNEVFPE